MGPDSSMLLKEVTLLQFVNEVVRAILFVGCEARNNVSQIIIPETVLGSPFNDGKIAMRGQDLVKQGKNDLPFHPVKTLPRSDECIGRLKYHILYASIHPVQVRMIPPWQRSSLLKHDLGKVYCIHSFYLARQSSCKITCSASHVEDGTWVVSDQCQECVNGFIRVSRTVMIYLDNTAILELFCILGPEMAWLWLH